MSEDKTVSFSLELNLEQPYRESRRFLTVASRTASIVRRLSGDENLDKLVRSMQQAVSMANRLRLALAALQTARMAAGDPLAWAMAGIAVTETALSIGDVVGSYG